MLDLWVKIQNQSGISQLTLTGFDIIRPSDKRIERQYYRPADATNNITEYGPNSLMKFLDITQLN